MLSKALLSLFIFGALAVAEPAAPTPVRHGAIFEWEDAQKVADHFAAFRLWIPENTAPVRGVIVLVPGYNGDGRGVAGDAAWQALAVRTRFALLGCFMKGTNGGAYAQAERWSGEVFVRGLRDLSRESQHPEIAEAPLAFWGHSAGGMFNYNFACWKPERVIAFIANKGAYYSGAAEGGVLEVPGLWFAGQKDNQERLQNITSFFTAGRRKGAPWCLALEPNAGHEAGRTKEVSLLFIETAIALRLKAEAEGESAGAGLRTVPKEAWEGGLSRHEIRRSDPRRKNGRLTSWLPDEFSARTWQAFVTRAPFPSAPGLER